MAFAPLLFVYGTLRDREIAAGVLGRVLAGDCIAPARARGWQAVYYPGEVYPALVLSQAGSADGLAIGGLSGDDLDRLDAFEGDQYRRLPIMIEVQAGTRTGQAYFPTLEIGPQAPLWTFETWVATHRPDVIARYRANNFSRE